jgi:hypothetical protein
MWRPGRTVRPLAMGRLGVVVLATAILLLTTCGMPSLEDLDLPPGTGDSILVLLPATVNVEVNTHAVFTAKGGRAPYSFEASEGSINASATTADYLVPGAPGTYIVSVTDAEGSLSEATVMATGTVPLNVSPATITVEAGTTVHLFASGGTGGYTFIKQQGDGDLTPGSDTATYIAYNADTAIIKVTSGSYETFSVIVSSAPPALNISPTDITLPPNTAFIFTATGGAGAYNWDCTGLGSVDGSGTYTSGPSPEDITVTVSDHGGHSATANVSVEISPTLILSPEDLSVTVGGTTTLVASGGTAPYFFALSGRGSISSATPSVTYTAPPTAGSPETATIAVTDSTTPDAGSTCATIHLEQPPVLRINPATISLITNTGVTFTATGGSGGYQYTVVGGTGTILAPPSSGMFTAPSVAETDTVRVTDSGGRTSDATVNVYFPLTIVPTEAFVATNGAYTFSASGGKPPYDFYLASGGFSIDQSTGVYEAPGSAGSATVQVIDALGNASYAAVTIYSPSWNIESVDTGFRSGQYASLALDPTTGDPRVAYYESQRKELRLVSRNGSVWSSQIVDEGDHDTVGQFCSLAIDPSTGYPRISYYDASNRDLKYAAWNGSSWSVQVVDSGGTVGQYTSLALDPATHRPRISYYDSSNRNLKYASWDGSSWVKSVVDWAGDVGKYSSLALDEATGMPRIAYHDASNDKLKYAAWDGSTWVLTNPDPVISRGEYCSLALDSPTGHPRISYYDSNDEELWYASFDGSTWNVEPVDEGPNDRGRYSSIALASSAGHYPRISYFDNTTKKLVYASYNGGSWFIQDAPYIDIASNVGSYTSLRLRSGNRAVIAYYSWSAQDLKVASEP